LTAPRLALLFGVHAHQPAGNFPAVIEQAHRDCYAPFLHTLADYPRFHCAAHFSGPLLDQLAAQFPRDVALLREMAARGQIEMFGAGDTEPVLAAIAHRDRIGQLERMAQRLERDFGARPRGAWLTERVWESTVVPALADSGIRYALVDDYHFLCTGKRADELDGFFTTEEDGRRLDLFAISEELRYRIPFAPAREAVQYLESLARPDGLPAAVYFDDIEKFGVWPETNEWVYGRRWLRDFIEGVLASPVLRTTTFAEYHAPARTRGVVYLPTTSYFEMNEWSLPAAAAAEYGALLAQEKDAGRFAQRKGYLRGGIWRNFFSRYPEANWMHKRMLDLSARLQAASGAASDVEALRSLLYFAQANDAYWHGLFGGLYLPHLRRSVWRHLLELEARLDALVARPARELIDLDHDGVDELFLRNRAAQAVLRLDGSAAVRELDSYRLAQNFGDTLRRHPEHYHDKARHSADTRHEGKGIASAHDRVSFRHPIDPRDLEPDSAARDIFVDVWIDGDGGTTPIAHYALEPGTGEHEAQFRSAQPRIVKRVMLHEEALAVRYEVAAERPGALRTTLDFALPSCDGFSGRYVDAAGAIRGGFGQPLELTTTSLTLDDRFMQGALVVTCAPAALVIARPYHTVSQSEQGFERVMQSATLTLEWPLPAGDSVVELRLQIRPDVH
jgi:hypothetical protein